MTVGEEGAVRLGAGVPVERGAASRLAWGLRLLEELAVDAVVGFDEDADFVLGDVAGAEGPDGVVAVRREGVPDEPFREVFVVEAIRPPDRRQSRLLGPFQGLAEGLGRSALPASLP